MFSYAIVEGTRSLKDDITKNFYSDKAYAIDISSAVINENTISYNSLLKAIDDVIQHLQKEPFEMGTLVLIPERGSYRVIYILKPTK